MLALNNFFFFGGEGGKIALNFFVVVVVVWGGKRWGWQDKGREMGKLQMKPSFWKSRYFYIVCKPFARANITEMALSFRFIYLSPLHIDRQIKMNLSRSSIHATSIYSSDSLFLFSLKRNLSFLFKTPSSPSLSLSLQASLQEALLPCFVPESAKGQTVEIAHPSGLFSHPERRGWESPLQWKEQGG